MALTLKEFSLLYDLKSEEIQREMYRKADLEVNCSGRYYKDLGEFVEKNPLYTPRVIRG